MQQVSGLWPHPRPAERPRPSPLRAADVALDDPHSTRRVCERNGRSSPSSRSHRGLVAGGRSILLCVSPTASAASSGVIHPSGRRPEPLARLGEAGGSGAAALRFGMCWCHVSARASWPTTLLSQPLGVRSNAARVCSNAARACSNAAGACSNAARVCSNAARVCSNAARVCSNATVHV
jgi:hypothetical protein